jgi:hypothetical protein
MPERRAIGSQSVGLSAKSLRPARRSTDGRIILDVLLGQSQEDRSASTVISPSALTEADKCS